MEETKTKYKYEALFWSIALPGFGQFVNKKLFKGAIFIFLEFVVNVMSNFNLAIVASFNGNIQSAIAITNYQWLMFYPCLYMYSLWDAFRDSNTNISPYLYLPYAFGAFFVTIGLIYSARITFFGVLIGPVFLPMLFLIPGLLVGFGVRKIIFLR
ncbi:hypothetical protein DS745_07925 [Anaerobacillus alkaliphilus]|uniref:Uncharacterized protein n=1 Tax=Anaerobacillus alkaliphilus TaxID=1548597 RepID=A0A4V1LGK2_9BACI|nr:hypothetical protein [Anaerobacillus alkaliphilus]RXJ02012.1 hypothetical protein DS745_07925 [Anaerobacillus alkaliphilus]